MDAEPLVTIHVPGPLRNYCGGQVRLDVAAGTISKLLCEIERVWPGLYRNICDETGAVRRHLNVFVNSENIRDGDGVASSLRTGDIVTFLPAVSGG